MHMSQNNIIMAFDMFKKKKQKKKALPLTAFYEDLYSITTKTNS